MFNFTFLKNFDEIEIVDGETGQVLTTSDVRRVARDDGSMLVTVLVRPAEKDDYEK